MLSLTTVLRGMHLELAFFPLQIHGPVGLTFSDIFRDRGPQAVPASHIQVKALKTGSWE